MISLCTRARKAGADGIDIRTHRGGTALSRAPPRTCYTVLYAKSFRVFLARGGGALLSRNNPRKPLNARNLCAAGSLLAISRPPAPKTIFPERRLEELRVRGWGHPIDGASCAIWTARRDCCSWSVAGWGARELNGLSRVPSTAGD